MGRGMSDIAATCLYWSSIGISRAALKPSRINPMQLIGKIPLYGGFETFVLKFQYSTKCLLQVPGQRTTWRIRYLFEAGKKDKRRNSPSRECSRLYLRKRGGRRHPVPVLSATLFPHLSSPSPDFPTGIHQAPWKNTNHREKEKTWNVFSVPKLVVTSFGDTICTLKTEVFIEPPDDWNTFSTVGKK